MYVWGNNGRDQEELEREHRWKGFVLYFGTYGTTEGFFFTESGVIIFGSYKYPFCSSKILRRGQDRKQRYKLHFTKCNILLWFIYCIPSSFKLAQIFYFLIKALLLIALLK